LFSGIYNISITYAYFLSIDNLGIHVKLKSLAAGATKSAYDDDTLIKAIRMSDTLPENFTSADENTISRATSRYPVYIWFDNTNDAGIIYVYTEAKEILMNSESSFMFYYFTSLTDLSPLASWDTGSVTDMGGMFQGATSLTDLSPLANWDTGSVTNMSYMFSGATSLTDLSALASWDTGSVTNMSYMFQNATSLTQAGVDAINAWDITKVGKGNFLYMFRNVPYHPTFTKRQGTWNSYGTFIPSS
jgi:surface protein